MCKYAQRAYTHAYVSFYWSVHMKEQQSKCTVFTRSNNKERRGVNKQVICTRCGKQSGTVIPEYFHYRNHYR